MHSGVEKEDDSTGADGYDLGAVTHNPENGTKTSSGPHSKGNLDRNSSDHRGHSTSCHCLLSQTCPAVNMTAGGGKEVDGVDDLSHASLSILVRLLGLF